MSTQNNILPVYDNLIEEHDKNELLRKDEVDYESPDDVANLMAKHLAKIFVAAHKKFEK